MTRRSTAAEQYRAATARAEYEAKLTALSARAREAAEPAFCLRCPRMPELEVIIAGFRCRQCKQVTVTVEGGRMVAT